MAEDAELAHFLSPFSLSLSEEVSRAGLRKGLPCPLASLVQGNSVGQGGGGLTSTPGGGTQVEDADRERPVGQGALRGHWRLERKAPRERQRPAIIPFREEKDKELSGAIAPRMALIVLSNKKKQT